ncbi:two pore domain potassium channel family protein [Paenalkalicoccus suaedae]|uniref:Two pore domain potassium channel family protein n=1 Tax=Paenalkalicoccus suaedae TaxID=2592382 RepID=A0A859FCR4_9BACI|nr:potassium channel family protein [Paenalkalicoccus suaedae]QKS70628.1 two pore domain potassium channel family protein [Paenalkalicoccus suaedae]
MLVILCTLAIAGMIISITIFLYPLETSRDSIKHFFLFLFVYAHTIVGFGIIYFCLSEWGLLQLIDHSPHTATIYHMLEDTIYFSAVTLLTIGYGDIVPLGLARWIVVVQALIGYLLPASFVVTSLHNR